MSSTVFFFFQAEDGIRDLVRSRGLGDVYKRQVHRHIYEIAIARIQKNALASPVTLKGYLEDDIGLKELGGPAYLARIAGACLLYTSDAADERSSVDLGGRRIIKKKNTL